MISDLQDQLREKEVETSYLNKQYFRAKMENTELLSLCCEKDKEIIRLNDEIKALREKIRQESLKDSSEYWKKEVLKKTEGINKLQDLFRYFQVERTCQIENDVKNLKSVFEEEKRSVENKLKIYSQREVEFLNKIDSLETENEQLKKHGLLSNKESMGDYLKKVEKLSEENTELKQQLEVIRKANNLHDLAMLSPDIHQISYQVHQLLIILQSLRAGKEISLRSLLTIDEANPISSSKQLILDVTCLKKDLNIIKEIVSDYHAEHLGFNICITQ